MAEWAGINEFVAVAETQGFTAAARRLDVSVAHISRQVSALEDRLGTRLLHRTTRKVSITAEGQLYYQHCRQLLDGLEDAERAVSELRDHPVGRLKMTAPMSFGERFIAPLVNTFVIAHPEVQVDLQLTNQQLDLVDQGIDLAIRVGLLEDSRLAARRLASRTQVLCASPQYLEKNGTPDALADLLNHNCLLGTLDHWRFTIDGAAGHIRVKGSLRCNSGHALVDAALSHIGVVQLPGYYVDELLKSGQLVEVLAKFKPPTEGVWALYPQNRHLLPKVRAMIDFLVEGLDDASYVTRQPHTAAPRYPANR